MRYRYLAIAVCGFAATVTQAVIIRESLVLFSGYELVSGLLLFAWLIWNGIGSYIFSRLRKQHSDNTYAWLMICTSLLALLTLTSLRFAPQMFGMQFGYIISVDKMFLITIILLAPVCFLNGALFPVACQVLDVPRVYWLEGIGAFLGGSILTLILIPILPSYGILTTMSIVISIAAMLLIRKIKLIFIPILLSIVFILTNDIELRTRQAQMAGQDLVAVRESRYGSIAVTRTDGQYNFYSHGFFDFSIPDRYSSEEAVHYAMLIHKAPQKVLLIGAGVASGVENVLMHNSIEQLTYIELDPALVNLALEYTAGNWAQDSRVQIIYGDARQILQNNTETYDVVILNLPEPSNIMLNRYYTTEFFKLIRERLNHGGYFSLRISAPIEIIDAMHGQLLNSIYRSLKQTFKSVLTLPAAKVVFISSSGPGINEPIADLLLTNLAIRRLDLDYINAGYVQYNLNDDRIAYLDQRINYFTGRINHDLEPTCYYYTTMLWSGTSKTIKRVFNGFKNPYIIIALLLLLMGFVILGRKKIIYTSLFWVGASTIVAEIMILILFQITYGYIYAWIGMLIACYMLGLSSGAYVFIKYLKSKGIAIISYLHIAIALLFFVQMIFVFSHALLARIFLSFLILLFGFCGGMHFPLAVHTIDPKRAGIAYAIDLSGAGLGALMISVFLIPLFGLFKIMICFIGINLLLAILLYLGKKSF